MSNSVVSSVLTALISGVLSGILVAYLNYWLTRDKTFAEIEKLKLDAEKLRRELNVESISSAVSYKITNSAERVIYDSTARDVGFDFRGARSQIWAKIDGKDQPISGYGEGTLAIENRSVLSIQRTNTEGRFEVWLERYFVDGKELAAIPANALISGKRGYRLDFEAKAVGAEHTLRIVFKNEETNKWLAEEKLKISTNTWTPFTIYFQTAPEKCRLRIDDLDVSSAPSSAQIRDLILTEKA